MNRYILIYNNEFLSFEGDEINITDALTERFNYEGFDIHIDECIAVLKRYNLPFDDEILQAIIFHHGKWSKYKPFEPNLLSKLIHVADMIASHLYRI